MFLNPLKRLGRITEGKNSNQWTMGEKQNKTKNGDALSQNIHYGLLVMSCVHVSSCEDGELVYMLPELVITGYSG